MATTWCVTRRDVSGSYNSEIDDCGGMTGNVNVNDVGKICSSVRGNHGNCFDSMIYDVRIGAHCFGERIGNEIGCDNRGNAENLYCAGIFWPGATPPTYL